MGNAVKVKFVVNGIFETPVKEFPTKKAAKDEYKRNRKDMTNQSIYTEIIFI